MVELVRTPVRRAQEPPEAWDSCSRNLVKDGAESRLFRCVALVIAHERAQHGPRQNGSHADAERNACPGGLRLLFSHKSLPLARLRSRPGSAHRLSAALPHSLECCPDVRAGRVVFQPGALGLRLPTTLLFILRLPLRLSALLVPLGDVELLLTSLIYFIVFVFFLK